MTEEDQIRVVEETLEEIKDEERVEATAAKVLAGISEPSDWPDLTRTAEALDAYDVADAAVKALYVDLPHLDIEESNQAYAARERAARAVREAFAGDTADRNQRATAMLIGPKSPWLRGLVQRWQRAREESLLRLLHSALEQRHFRTPEWLDDPSTCPADSREVVIEGLRSIHGSKDLHGLARYLIQELRKVRR